MATIEARPEEVLEGSSSFPVALKARGRLGADYLKLWSATAVSNVGDGVRLTALPLLAAVMTRSPLLVSGVTAAGMLPWLLFSLHAGAIADRVDRRRLMVAVNVARGIVMVGLAVAVAAGLSRIVLLYGIVLLQGIGEVFSDSAAFALLPSLVPEERLEDANGRLEAAISVTYQFAGPALGGLLFAIAMGAPFVVDAASFLIAGGLFAAIRHRVVPDRVVRLEKTSIRQEIGEGLRSLWMNRYLRTITLLGAGCVFFLYGTFAIYVLYLLHVIGISAPGVGLFLSIEAAGSITGALAAGKLRNKLGTAGALAGALVVAGGANLALGVTGAWPLVAVMAVAISFAAGVWNVVNASFRQRLVPDALLGRSQSAYRFLAWGAIPVGSLVGGIVGTTLGLRAPFVIGGVALVVLAAIARVALAGSDGATPTVVLPS
ncbi:MAG: MFS transporter [Actinomycetota bacterium]|nr:MFS transporter [Actinomycetota bacterium]